MVIFSVLIIHIFYSCFKTIAVFLLTKCKNMEMNFLDGRCIAMSVSILIVYFYNKIREMR